LTRRNGDHISGADLHALTVLVADEPLAGQHMEDLSARVRVPVGPSAWLKVHDQDTRPVGNRDVQLSHRHLHCEVAGRRLAPPQIMQGSLFHHFSFSRCYPICCLAGVRLDSSTPTAATLRPPIAKVQRGPIRSDRTPMT